MTDWDPWHAVWSLMAVFKACFAVEIGEVVGVDVDSFFEWHGDS